MGCELLIADDRMSQLATLQLISRPLSDMESEQTEMSSPKLERMSHHNHQRAVHNYHICGERLPLVTELQCFRANRFADEGRPAGRRICLKSRAVTGLPPLATNDYMYL